MNISRLNSRLILVAGLWLAGLSTGCGDFVANEGNLGKLVYSLHTDYLVVENELDEVNLITGVEHRIMVTPTGDLEVDDPSAIMHIMAPADGVTIITDEASGTGSVGDAVFTVETARDYTLQSWLGTELIDYIVLHLADAEAIDVITFVHGPEDDGFEPVYDDTIELPLYSQATFLGKPVDVDGNTLVGDISLEFATLPADAAVDVYNLDAVYENAVWGSTTPINMIFVKTGNVDVILTENLTGLQHTVSFNITEPAVEQEDNE